MPNGGVPLNLLIEPPDGRVVIHVHCGQLKLYGLDDWRRSGTSARRLATLDEHETRALAGFLGY
jgi:hypothetical protein